MSKSESKTTDNITVNYHLVSYNDKNYLQCVVAGSLNQLLERLLVIILAWSGQWALVLHDFIGKCLAVGAEEFTCASFDIFAPVCVLHVLGSWDEIQAFRF